MSFILAEDEALKAALQDIVVADEKNSNRSVGVFYANPDIEERKQSYPYITIEMLDSNWSRDRQTSGVIVDMDAQGTTEMVENRAYTYETPIAWDLMYQVTTYARHPRHDRQIMAYLLNRVFVNNRGFLAVTNELGTETGYRHMFLQEFTKRDMIEDGRRLYRSVFTVIVTSEGDAITGTAARTVSSVLINSTTAHIPTGKQPV
jgi:hypothetical protein